MVGVGFAMAIGFVAKLVDRILTLPRGVALAFVFALPALEASAFLGFVFPGEIAVLLGGVLAFQGRITLPEAILAAVSGAIVGDTAGYFIGRRWGHAILHGTLGRLPFVRRHLGRSLDSAKAYLNRRGGRAIVVGRFTTAFRVLVPGLAGMSGMPYGRFLVANAVGALLWGTGFVLLGYAGGEAWRRVEGVAGLVGLALLALVVTGLIAIRVVRSWSDRNGRVRTTVERLAHVPPLSWIRARLPRQVAWVRRRLDTTAAQGFALTFAVAAAGLCVWAFASLTQDVARAEEAVRLDLPTERWLVAHRTAWVTGAMKVLTWLGSSAVVVPVVAVAAVALIFFRRQTRQAVTIICVMAGGILLSQLTKGAVDRPRPAPSIQLVRSTGSSFPSGHTMYALAGWGILAIVSASGRPVRTRVALWGAASMVALVVGFSRLYLGVHWLTDVLAAYAGGGILLAAAAAVLLTWRPVTIGEQPNHESADTDAVAAADIAGAADAAPPGSPNVPAGSNRNESSPHT